MNALILHHYPQSPVSEKVRIALGIKGLSWRSVIIPRIPPKPKLMPLTGGFRLTPVLQIGADIYCDSQRILLELEQRFPDPTFFPDGSKVEGLVFARWTDGAFFQKIIATVFAEELSRMPEEFATDRIALYFGGDATVASFQEALPNNIAVLKAQFEWISDVLFDQPYLHGARPGYKDAHAYYLLWFLRGRYPGGDEFLREFPSLTSWASRLEGIGHGTVEEETEDNALEIARGAAPLASSLESAPVTAPFETGQRVAVRPDNDENETVGTLLSMDFRNVSVLRHDEDIGEVAVHFPRVGYAVRSVD